MRRSLGDSFRILFPVFAGLIALAPLAAAQELPGDDAGDSLVAEDDAELERGRESVDIEPYTGPPVYLDEGEAPPPPTVVESRLIKETYKETDTPHFERTLVRYSDDSYVSDGPHKEYYASGQLFVSGAFEKGRPTGEWAYYHANGTLAKKVTFVDGLPDGRVETFDADGKPTSIRSYQAGARHGEWIIYATEADAETQMLRQANYKEGKADGEWKVWFKNGQLRQRQTFVDGKRDGEAMEWSRGGDKRAIANFKAGKRTGKTTIFRRDGVVVERIYEDDRLVSQTESDGESS